MDQNDQDIDTAGTEADDEFRARHDGEVIVAHDPTAEPQGATPAEADQPRGSDPRTLHRGEDDPVAHERSPEFHDQPGSGRHLGRPPRPTPDDSGG